MADTALTTMTVAELGRLIREARVSPVEVAEAFLDRIDALQPRLNAFITVTREQALAAARQAEAEIASGRYRGPLHGIPVGLKDLFWTRGVRTTSGSAVTADFVPDEDATVVSRLAEAGASFAGKTNMVEYAYGGAEHNDLYGAPRNPWALDRATGGSSSGSGAAVASGQVPLALGTDTAGSVRSPASLCGLSGLKPTYGLVSRFGVTPLSWSQDHVGPMAHTVEDVAIAMNVLAGYDPRDPGSARREPQDYTGALDGDVKGLRVGVPRNYVWDVMDSEVKVAFDKAMAQLGELGAQVDDVEIPGLDTIWAAQMTISSAEATTYHAERIRAYPELYHPTVRQRIEAGFFQPAHAYVQSLRVRNAMAGTFDDVFRRFDLLATPTTPSPAPLLEEAAKRGSGGEVSSRQLVRITRLFNLNGLPAISVPCGFSSEGLPIGLQLVGRRFDDAGVIHAAHVYQTATDWHTRRPGL